VCFLRHFVHLMPIRASRKLREHSQISIVVKFEYRVINYVENIGYAK